MTIMMAPNPTSSGDKPMKEVCLELSKYDECDTSVAITDVSTASSACHEKIIPASPIRKRRMPTGKVHTTPPEATSLESMMKKKYPQFLHTLPKTLPSSRKRRRPVCCFVNFMGTRMAPTMKQPELKLKYAVLNPTSSPGLSNMKRGHPSSSLEADAETSMISKRKHVKLNPSPYPTDAPTRTPMTSDDFTKRPYKKQTTTTTPFPTLYPSSSKK